MDSDLFDAQVFAAAQHVLKHAEADFERPVDGLLAHILAVAVMAHALDMSLPSLLGGVSAAYYDMIPVNEDPLQ